MKSKEFLKKGVNSPVFSPFLPLISLLIFIFTFQSQNSASAETISVPIYQGTNKDFDVTLGFAEDTFSPFQFFTFPNVKLTETNLGFTFDFLDPYRTRLTNITTNYTLDTVRRDGILKRRAVAIQTNDSIIFPEGLSELHLRRHLSSSAKRLLNQINPQKLIKNSQLSDAEEILTSTERLVIAAGEPSLNLTGYYKTYFRSMWTGKLHRLEVYLPKNGPNHPLNPPGVVYFLADGDFPFEAICRAIHPSNDHFIIVRPGFENSSTAYTQVNAETLFETQMIVEGSLPVNKYKRSIVSPETTLTAFFHYQYSPEKYFSLGLLPAQTQIIGRTNDTTLAPFPAAVTTLFLRPNLIPPALPTNLPASDMFSRKEIFLSTNEPMNLETQRSNFNSLLSAISAITAFPRPITAFSVTNPKPHEAKTFFHFLSSEPPTSSNHISIRQSGDQIQITGTNLNSFYIDTTQIPRSSLGGLRILLNGKTIFQNMDQEPFQVFVTNRGQTYRIR